jgi:hypothetical protein
VCSELVFAVESVLTAANQCLLPKFVVCSKIGLAIEIVLSVANQCSLPKLCCLQRISVQCRNCVVYSESVFAAKFLLSTANLFLLTIMGH